MSEVVFVGTSDAFGAGGRRQAAILHRSSSGAVLLDCGGTTGSGLGALSIEREEVDAIIVSHFHADHFSGIPQFLLASAYEDSRQKPLILSGPPGIESQVVRLAEAVGHPLDQLPVGFVRFVEFSEQELEIGPVRVSAFGTHHQPASRPHGIRINDGDHVCVYSGDTGWFERLPQCVAGADVFVSECTFYDTDFDYHLNYLTLEQKRELLDCGRLVLTHLGPDMSRRRGQLELETADDGMSLSF